MIARFLSPLPNVCNSIPNDVRCAPSLSLSKSRLQTYLLRSIYKYLILHNFICIYFFSAYKCINVYRKVTFLQRFHGLHTLMLLCVIVVLFFSLIIVFCTSYISFYSVDLHNFMYRLYLFMKGLCAFWELALKITIIIAIYTIHIIIYMLSSID